MTGSSSGSSMRPAAPRGVPRERARAAVLGTRCTASVRMPQGPAAPRGMRFVHRRRAASRSVRPMASLAWAYACAYTSRVQLQAALHKHARRSCRQHFAHAPVTHAQTVEQGAAAGSASHMHTCTRTFALAGRVTWPVAIHITSSARVSGFVTSSANAPPPRGFPPCALLRTQCRFKL
eukprot:53280-Chlamydomonas_euryale.AAC.1